jgi:hypothetical protein
MRTARDDTKDTRTAAQLLTWISALEAAISQAETDNGDQENDQTAGNTNHNHNALKRVKRS